MSGRWVSVTMADGTTREDWVPAEQPAPPARQPGQWHIVTPTDGESTWEWHPRPAPPLPPRPAPAADPPRPPFAAATPGYAQTPARSAPPEPREPEDEPYTDDRLGWRKGTWIILAFNVLMLVWVAAGGSTAAGQPHDCGVLSAHACNEASDTGTAIGVGLLIILWALGDIILGVVWLVTNARYRECPACGRKVKKGRYSCEWCRHDFRAALGRGYY